MGVFTRIYSGFNFKYFRHFLFINCSIFCFCFCMALVAGAYELDVDSTEVSETDYIYSSMESRSETLTTQESSSEMILTDFNTTIQSISAQDTTGFKSVVLGLLGPYEMLTKEYTYTNPSSSYQSKQVTTEPDYAWMISAGIFIIVLYCLLRILGGVICGRG